jgi:putative membrane protein
MGGGLRPWWRAGVLDLSSIWVVTAELALFCARAGALLRPWARQCPSVRSFHAGNMARRQFIECGLHHTAGETGLLIFVSEAEHYVEILADRGIARHVEPARWQAIVDQFVGDVRAGRTRAGFLAAIAACGDILAEVCPKTPDNQRARRSSLLVGDAEENQS